MPAGDNTKVCVVSVKYNDIKENGFAQQPLTLLNTSRALRLLEYGEGRGLTYRDTFHRSETGVARDNNARQMRRGQHKRYMIGLAWKIVYRQHKRDMIGPSQKIVVYRQRKPLHMKIREEQDGSKGQLWCRHYRNSSTVSITGRVRHT